jgi:hypothetical protein
VVRLLPGGSTPAGAAFEYTTGRMSVAAGSAGDGAQEVPGSPWRPGGTRRIAPEPERSLALFRRLPSRFSGFERVGADRTRLPGMARYMAAGETSIIQSRRQKCRNSIRPSVD